MRITRRATRLEISEVEELTAANSERFASRILPEMAAPVKEICIRFASNSELDCTGISTIVALRNQAADVSGSVTLRLVDPPASARRLLAITGLRGWYSGSSSLPDFEGPENDPLIAPVIPEITATGGTKAGTSLSAFAA